MSNTGFRRSASTVCVIVMILVLLGDNGRVSGQSCHLDVTSLITRCSKYVSKVGPKVRPSSECCSVIKPADLPCVCKFVTKDIEAMISMKKAVYVVRTCGLEVPKGMKCGSYTVPNAIGEIKA